METNQNQVNFVELRVGSDSDLPKLKPLIDGLREQNIPVLIRILSAHRTPEEMVVAAKEFPDVIIVGVDNILDQTKINIKLCIGSAGGSAHLPGMTASETHIPVVAIPVESSAMGKMDAIYSMVNMPPGVPNGMIADYGKAAEIIGNIWRLEKEDTQKLYIPASIQTTLLPLIQKFGVADRITNNQDEAKIGIHFRKLDTDDTDTPSRTQVPIIIPTVEERVTKGRDRITDNLEYNTPGLAMGIQIESKLNPENAFLYAMELLGLFSENVATAFKSHRQANAIVVKGKDIHQVNEQINNGSLNAVLDVALPERYKRTHGGKVRETYQHPDNPNQLIMIATDRISTHDVVHKNRIPGKGKVLTQVSNFWFKYFQTQEATEDIPTQLVGDAQFPADFPEQYKDRAIIVKKLSPLPVEAIVRDRLYGSIVSGYNTETGMLATGEFVGKGLIKGSSFDETKFTPSTKGKVDVNINFDDMTHIIKERLQENHPQYIDKAAQYAEQVKDYSIKMFTVAKDKAKTESIILADTKFEFAIDSEGVLHIIDEVLTPDSSRYRKADGYVEGEEPESFDKQDTRDYVMETWKKNGQIKEKPPLELPDDIIAKTQQRYTNLQEIFA